MKKKWLLLSALISLISRVSASDISLQEAVELRRIAEYCKENNFFSAKTQIHCFFNKFPHSSSKDALYAMLGDIFFTENDYASALKAYSTIHNEDLHLKTEFRRIHCLHQLMRFEELIESTRTFLKEGKPLPEEIPTLRLQLASALLQQATSMGESEDKDNLLQQAQEQFHHLAGTEYNDQRLLPLASIYTSLKQYPQAVKIYTQLIQSAPEHAEEHLLQTLQLQLLYDKTAAIETCRQIYNLNGPAAAHAAFNELSLLFQEKHYEEIAASYERICKQIAEQYLPLAYYYIGKSLFHTKDYHQAALYLEKYLLAPKQEEENRTKNALLSLLQCSNQMQDLALFEKTLTQIKSSYPYDLETAKASLLYVELCRKQGKNLKAIANLKEVLETFTHLSCRDNILYDYALLLAQEHNWSESAQAFETFLKQFPSHSHYQKAWHYLIECRIQATCQASPEESFAKKEQLAQTLHSALREKNLFEAQESRAIHLMYARALFETQKYPLVLEELASYVKEYPDDPKSAQAYVLIALSHYYANQKVDLYIDYAEKALSLDSTIQQAAKLHINLFNAYLEQAQKADASAKNAMLLKAADHLFAVIDEPLKKENKLWLVSFYSQQAKENKDLRAFYLDRSICILEKILQFNPNAPELTVVSDALEIEAQAIQLAELYAAKHLHSQRIALLQTLIEKYKTDTESAWKYQRLAHFELATAYKEQKEYEKAFEIYSFLITSSTHASSYFATAAQLDKSLLEFSLLSEGQKQANTQEMQTICDTLKELGIKRKLFSEPFHLEAALCYIDILTGAACDAQEMQRRIALLSQMQESFSSLEDPLVEQYLSTKEQFPDKHHLYTQYMDFITAEIDALKAKLAQMSGEKEKAAALAQQAENRLLILSDTALHARLKERVENNKQKVKTIL